MIPEYQMTGKEIKRYMQAGVYAWKRGPIYLYIGASNRPLARLLRHNIIGIKDILLDDDIIEFYPCTDKHRALILENKLLCLHSPVLNGEITYKKERMLEQMKDIRKKLTATTSSGVLRSKHYM